MHDAAFVLFDRKLEFVNDVFAELFGVSPTMPAAPISIPEPRCAGEQPLIREQYQKGCCSAFTMQQFNFTGLSKNGRKIECETILLFIPYKWGVAIQGTLRPISASSQIDKILQNAPQSFTG